jgi:hypothetical protein
LGTPIYWATVTGSKMNTIYKNYKKALKHNNHLELELHLQVFIWK